MSEQLARDLVENMTSPAWLNAEGWSFLGAGAYRRVWLGPDGNVYKVQHSTDNCFQENYWEWENYQLNAESIAASGIVRLARCIELYTDSNVIVMEYLPKTDDAFESDWDEYGETPINADVSNACKILRKHEIYDTNEFNLYYSNGELVMVDYAG